MGKSGIEEAIVAVFAVKGFNDYINRITGATKAVHDLAEAERRLEDLRGKGPGKSAAGQAAWAGQVLNAQAAKEAARASIDQANAVFSSLMSATNLSYAFQRMVGFIREGVMETTKFYNELLNIRDVTGSTGKESFGLAMMAQVAGISDISQMRELLMMNRALFSAKGQSAMGRIGVSANPNVHGIQLFNQIADGLQKVPSGMRRTQVLEDIFGGAGGMGVKGVTALLPLLRMTKDQRDEIGRLSETYIPNLDKRTQQFTTSLAMLGQWFKRGIVDPIVNAILPVINVFMNALGTLIYWFTELNKFTHGIAGGILAFAAVLATTAVGAWAFVAGLNFMKTSVAGLIVEIRMAIPQLMMWLALLEPWQLIAGGVALAATAGVLGYSAWNSQNGGDAPASKFDGAVDKFGDAVNRIGDNFDQLKGSGIPTSIGEVDVASITRRMAGAAIG